MFFLVNILELTSMHGRSRRKGALSRKVEAQLIHS